MAEEFERRKGEFLVFAILLGFGFFINRGVELKGLYMDDLYLWSCYGEQSFSEFVFPVGSSRFRFVFYLAAWLELLLLGNHITWMVPFNIILNALIAYTLYRIAMHLSKRRGLVSLALGLAYLLSRFAYYQIGQFYGLMESLGLWAALGLFYCLYRYGNERNTKAFLWGCFLYFLASFIHERYMVLFPVLLLALLLGTNQENGRGLQDEMFRGRSRLRGNRAKSQSRKELAKGVLLLISAGVFALILLLRFLTIGTLSPAGTGGTDVADTFEMSKAIGHAWTQTAFVFGRNAGPDYLCLLPYEDSPSGIQRLILFTNIILAAAVVCFVVCMLRDRRRLLVHLKNSLLALSFIALCIGSSSVTIRVEMRWIYVVYASALLFLAYMSRIMGKAGILVFLYLAFLFPVETFYREQWKNLYFWPNQLRYNSLAEETVGKYGNKIYDKQVYIIGNGYELSDFTAETFLKVYDTEHKGTHTTLRFIDSDFDIKEITDDMVILSEDPAGNAYQDVTDFLKTQRFNLAYGSYDDGWIDKHAKIVFLNGNARRLVLSCYYPGTVTGDQVCEIKMNGKTLPKLVFTDNLMHYELEVAPYQMISLEFSCNFHVANAQETRGDEKMAMIVEIEAD
ncbi:MAG: hypothetical protein HFE84_03215 [Lachnospiraceae bacterium]|nr:hypothetical protein [Lachnospiraceae bacterium]